MPQPLLLLLTIYILSRNRRSHVMRFSCDKDTMARELANAQEVIASKNALSVLSNVFLQTDNDALTIRATDLKVGFETSLPVKTSTPGTTTVFCDKLLGIVRSLPPGEVEVSLDEEQMLLSIRPTGHKIEFDLKSIAPDKYPEQQIVPEELYFEFPQKDFLAMVAKTIFAVSDDETRYFLNGVYLERTDEGLRMVATDGKRLSLASSRAPVTAAAFKGVIVPPKIFGLLRKLASGEGALRIAITDKNVFFGLSRYRIFSNLIEAQFPNYDRVIPKKQSRRIVVDREPLSDALRRVSLLVEQKSRKVLLSVADDTLTVHTSEGEMGKASEQIACQYQGPSLTFAVNFAYVTEPLKEMAEKTVAVEFTESDKALTIRSEPAGDYFHVVMPMQQT
jgi:DNA polymerase III subunit beta